MKEEEGVKQRLELVAGELNERTRRPLAASEAVVIARGGIEEQGCVTPYGVYDQGRNTGWVNVGIDHDYFLTIP